MRGQTSFTVAIPTHNRRETVVLAALSAIRQSRVPDEVLVLCDGCTDGTADAIAGLNEPRIRAVELPKGPGYAYAHRDLAVEHGTGDVVTWLADDDLFLPDHIERIGAQWDTGDVDIVVSPAVIVHEDDRFEWIGRDWRVPEHRSTMLTRTNTSVMASVSVRRQVVADVGGWDGTIERAADWDLWKRILEHGARPGWVDAATVLHFRATTRRQAWSLRVAQNTRWLDRIGEPEGVAGVRQLAEVARSTWEADLAVEIDELRRVAQALTDEATRAHEAAAASHQRAEQAERATSNAEQAAQSAQQAAQSAQLELARLTHVADEAERLRAALSDAEQHVRQGERDRATLEAIYAGRWWRLRGRVRRLAGRAP